MFTPSKNYQSLKLSYTNNLYGIALKKGGCIFLTGSCPTPTPKEVYEKLLEAFIKENKFCSYNVGSFGLKKEIAKYIKERSNFDVNINNNILITLGATTFLQQLFLYLMDEDSNCLVITPTYQDYFNEMRFTRASITETAMDEVKPNWHLDIKKVENSIKKNTKIILLCSPNNPTGKIYSLEELTGLGEIAKKHGIFLVVDEAYNYLTYEKEFVSVLDIPQIRENIIVACTFSKEFSMCGWRVGHTYVPNSIYNDLFHLQLSLNLVASAVSQKAAEISLQSAGIKKQIKKDIQANLNKRNYVMNCIDEIGKGLSYIKPQACPYLFVKYTKDIKSYDLCKDIIDKAKVIVSPGIGNGLGGEYHFCITFADEIEVIEEGMNRLKYYFKEFYN